MVNNQDNEFRIDSHKPSEPYYDVLEEYDAWSGRRSRAVPAIEDEELEDKTEEVVSIVANDDEIHQIQTERTQSNVQFSNHKHTNIASIIANADMSLFALLQQKQKEYEEKSNKIA